MESCMDYVCNAKKLKDLKNKDNLKYEDNLWFVLFGLDFGSSFLTS